MNNEHRVRKLDALRDRTSVPTVRVYHAIIRPERVVVGAYVEGQHFDCAEGSP